MLALRCAPPALTTCSSNLFSLPVLPTRAFNPFTTHSPYPFSLPGLPTRSPYEPVLPTRSPYEPILPTRSSYPFFLPVLPTTYILQVGQADLVADIFGHARGGFFVDLVCCLPALNCSRTAGSTVADSTCGRQHHYLPSGSRTRTGCQ